MTNKLNLLLLLLFSAIAMAQATADPAVSHEKIVRISDSEITSLEGINFPDATKIEIFLCSKLESLKGLQTPKATKISIWNCHNLTSLGDLDAPVITEISIWNCGKLISLMTTVPLNATEIIIRQCPALITLADGLNAPKLVTLTVDDYLEAEKTEILQRKKRWSPARTAWVNAVIRGTMRCTAASTANPHGLSLDGKTERPHHG